MLEILRTPEFERDRDLLIESNLQVILDMLIERIANGEHIIKKSLGKVKGVADLRGCWSVKFDLLGYPNRYRLVIRYLPHDFAPTELLLVAVGPRFDHQVYRWADSRLN